MIPPVLAAEIAAKGKQTASKAITGDVYIRRWTTTRTTGKGKKKRTITTEHEAHVNPFSIAIGAAVTAVTVGGALWLMQMGAKPIKVETTKVITATHTQFAQAAKTGWTEFTYRTDLQTGFAVRGANIVHPAVVAKPDIWTVKKGAYGYGIPSTAPTAQDAVYKAYPKLKGLGFTVAAPDAATRVYTFSEWKTRLEVKERAGFELDIL